jgi:fatty-acyl-CoA synthase
MKLSLSTNGWEKYGWAELFAASREAGFSGIELHGISQPGLSGPGMPFSPENISKTARRFADTGFSVACVDALADIADASQADESVCEISECIDAAARLRCRYVRVHAVSDRGPDTDSAVRALIDKVLPIAEGEGIMLLIETTGVYADTARLCGVLDGYASDSLGALWDMHHPYRCAGESAGQTIEHLGAYVRHVHIRDSSAGDDGPVSFRLMGDGDLPVSEMIDALRSIGYDGFVSWECFPGDFEGLDDTSVLLPHFCGYMRRFESEGSYRPGLPENRAGTGRYVWPKDELIDLTFPKVLDRMVREFPDQLVFKYTTLDYTRTYSQFRDDADAFARTLVAMGVGKGDHVAIWATNIPQWFITFWAAVKIGAVLVTVNTAYKIHEAEYLLRQSDTRVLVMIENCRDSDYRGIINELCPEIATSVPGRPLHCRRLPFLRGVVTVGFRMSGVLTWDEALKLGEKVPAEEIARRAAAVRPDDVANMQYTSGTTGFPKGVMLTHRNIVNNGKCIGDRMDLSTADRMMVQVPMFHCFGMVLSMTSVMTHGATLFPMPYFSPKSSLACVTREHITCFNGVPTMFIAMRSHPDFASSDFSYIRTGIMAGSNCPPELMRMAASDMNMKEIVSVYGQTESSPGCTMSSVDDTLEVRTTTVGRAFPHVECKIVDPATNQDLPDGQNGEFVARGYNLMKGYYKMPRATREAIDAGGWLHTGDIACRDPDGNYRITGRLKDMIIRGGENIYPRELEEFYYGCPGVSDVQVVGVPDERYGEECMAWIIPEEGKELTVDYLRTYAAERIARHKVPRYIYICDSFPMNDAGKILKYRMRETGAAMLKDPEGPLRGQ